MEDRFKQIASWFGLELGEKFRILNREGVTLKDFDGSEFVYEFTKDGLHANAIECGDAVNAVLGDLITGVSKVKKDPFEPQYGEKYYKLSFMREKNDNIWRFWIDSVFWTDSDNNYKTRDARCIYKTPQEVEQNMEEDFERLTGIKFNGLKRKFNAYEKD